MAVGDYQKLEDTFSTILKTGKGDADDLARKLAKAITEHLESVKFEIPVGKVLINATGQCVPVKNIAPIEVKLK